MQAWKPGSIRTELLEEKNLEVAVFNHRGVDYRRDVLIAMINIDMHVLRIMRLSLDKPSV